MSKLVWVYVEDGEPVDDATLNNWFREDYDENHLASEWLEEHPEVYRDEYQSWLERMRRQGLLSQEGVHDDGN